MVDHHHGGTMAWRALQQQPLPSLAKPFSEKALQTAPIGPTKIDRVRAEIPT